MHRLRIMKRELIPLSNRVSTANNAGLTLLGGILVNITGASEDGELITTKQLCYIVEGMDYLFLSKEACRELGIIPKNFPSIGTFSKGFGIANMSSAITSPEPQTGDTRPC